MNSIPQKQCSTCLNSYPATPEFFSRDRSKSDGLRTTCKACRKAYYEARKEHFLHYAHTHQCERTEYMRSYRQTPKNKAYADEYRPRHYQTHRLERIEKRRQYYELHKEEINAQRRQYRKEHPEIQSGIDRAHAHKRKAQKKGVGGVYTAQQIQEQLKRQKSRCYYCHKKLEKYHVDHIVPLARGGSNDISNIVLACPACNMRKNDKFLHEWPDGGRLL